MCVKTKKLKTSTQNVKVRPNIDMRPQVCTFTTANMHTYIHDLGQSYIHTHTHAYIYIYIYIYIYANMRVFFGREYEASFTCMHIHTHDQETDHDTYV